MAKVIEHRFWRNTRTGQSASCYGALPHWPETERELVVKGWSIRWPDGTVGTHHGPFGTREGAEQYAKAQADWPGWSSMTM